MAHSGLALRFLHLVFFFANWRALHLYNTYVLRVPTKRLHFGEKSRRLCSIQHAEDNPGHAMARTHPHPKSIAWIRHYTTPPIPPTAIKALPLFPSTSARYRNSSHFGLGLGYGILVLKSAWPKENWKLRHSHYLFALQPTQVPILFTQATFASEDAIFASGHEHTKDGRLLGVKGCFNPPMGIWQLTLPTLQLSPLGTKLTCTTSKLTPPNRSCHSPRVLYDANHTPIKLFWFLNPIGGAHASCVSLEFRDLVTGTNNVLVDTIVEPTPSNDFPGLYPEYNMPSSPFLHRADRTYTEDEGSSSDEEDSHEDGKETEIPAAPTLTSHLANSVWRGITNQSSMDNSPSPPSPTSPLQSQSPTPPPQSPPEQIASNLSLTPPPSSIWGYAGKLKDSDAVAAFTKVSISPLTDTTTSLSATRESR
ncbi:hypothetical protein EDB19DRAFT_1943707 [Suillus lakei]|nr:hypothetical protein EDB19DRAFT_1943707 [Suillus lakei]